MSKIVEAGLTDGQFLWDEQCLWRYKEKNIVTSCFMDEPMKKEYENFSFCPWCGNHILREGETLHFEL